MPPKLLTHHHHHHHAHPFAPRRVPPGLAAPAEAIIDGDALCACIAAASIIAKVTRDRLMLRYDAAYPQYGFAQHKGYGTARHRAAIHEHGPCPIHRRSFEPVKGITGARAAPALALMALMVAGIWLPAAPRRLPCIKCAPLA